jgi:acetyl esterase/lipase
MDQEDITLQPTQARRVFFVCLTVFVACGIIFVFLPSCGERVIKDIPYVVGDVVGEHRQCHLLDLYVPFYRNIFDKPRSLIVWIHGGAWKSGDKKATPGPVLALAGYVCASINYRLTDEAAFPAQIDDCRAALKFLRQNSAQYGIDPERIGIWGLSAGGHLAALLALAPEESRAQPSRTNAAIKAVCDWAGPADFITISEQADDKNTLELDSPTGAVAKLLNGLPKQKPALARAASPVNYVTSQAPPFLIVHGEKDNVVPPEQSKELAKLLAENNVSVELIMVPGVKHDLNDVNLVTKSIDFFDRHLK